MPSKYYDSSSKIVFDGDIAVADDLNSVNTAADTAFQIVDSDITIIANNQPYYTDLAQKWAEEVEDTPVTPGHYSALHWAAKSAADAIQTAADRVQTGLDAASADSDASTASSAASDAEAWANTPYNTEITPGVYSALHWATVATNEAAAFSPSGLLADLLTVDGTASGLDADLLDGQHGSYYAPLASPALSGTPTAPTAALETNTTQIATTAFVQDTSAELHIGRKNYIINGGFTVYQRGTSGSSLDDYVSLDRWKITGGVNSPGTLAVVSFTLGQTVVPGNPSKYAQMTFPALESDMRVGQRIESVASLSGTTATISFWASAASAKTFKVVVEQRFGTGGSPSSDVIVQDTDISVGTDFAKYEITINIPSVSGKTLGSDGNDYLLLSFGYEGVDGATLRLAQVQVEEGPIATEFERRTYADELFLCQRYLRIISALYAVPRFNSTTNTVRLGQAFFEQPMRAVPTRSIGSLVGWNDMTVEYEITQTYFVIYGYSASAENMTVAYEITLDAEL